MTGLPATVTDALRRGSPTTYLPGGGYTIVQTPSRRDFWFGNCLIPNEAPSLASYEGWLERCRDTFAGVPIEKLIVQWETAAEVDDAVRPQPGAVEFDVSRVLVLSGTPNILRRAGVASRPLSSDADWAGATALERVEQGFDLAGMAAFFAWRMGLLRAASERGDAIVLGAFAGDALVAFAGCYASEAWIRLTTPITATPFRRRGLFSTLFSNAVGEAYRRFPKAKTVVVSEPGSAPERLYRTLGFAPAGYQYALLAPLTIGARLA